MAEPAEPLEVALQAERKASVRFLSAPSAHSRQPLLTSRQEAETRAATFVRAAHSRLANLAAGDELEHRVDDLTAALASLAQTRAAIDAHQIQPAAAAEAFTGTLNQLRAAYKIMARLDDVEVMQHAETLIALSRAWELMSQEDALMAGVLATGQLTDADQTQITYLVGAWRAAAADAIAELPQPIQAEAIQVTTSDVVGRLRALEERVVTARPGGPAPVTAEEWSAAMDPARTQVRAVVVTAGNEQVVAQTTVIAAGIGVRLLLVVVIGLVLVLMLVRGWRDQARRLTGLQLAARQLADERLPSLVARLGRGETVDVAAEAPPLDFGADEIGQVGDAFAAAQRTAVDAAVQQAELRRDVREMFLNIARRSQSLLHRQITALTDMEQHEKDEDVLAKFYVLDHLATRMRRHAENLIVLSGANPARTWKQPQPVLDVIRAALGEVEGYQRVRLGLVGDANVAGRAVRDVAHLLAELIENALAFSPPTAPVEVSGQTVGTGYGIDIEDRGLGMAADDLDDINSRLAAPAEIKLSQTTQLGLAVVSHLADRHGIRVRLKPSPYGGITAVVVVQASLMTGPAEDADDLQHAARAATAPGSPPTQWPVAVPSAPAPGERAAHRLDEKTSAPSASTGTVQALPNRRRQAHLHERLRGDADDSASSTDQGRLDPDDAGQRMAAFQAGTRSARAAIAGPDRPRAVNSHDDREGHTSWNVT
ncbi:sensor histidine kinase [Dactylosporangium darangshiense]